MQSLCTLKGVKLQQDVQLAPYTTLGVGGPARFFADVASEADLLEGLQFAQERELSVFVLGGGSNLLVSDAGFDGLVLRMAMRGVAEQAGRVTAAAGEPWDAFVQFTVDKNLAGIECLAGIPGTVGGTPVQNVGAYGQEVAETIASVRAYDRDASAFVDLDAGECGFAYRTSRFNTVDQGRFIVTAVKFALQQDGKPSLRYADLAKHFADEDGEPTLAEVAEVVRAVRAMKGMLTAAAGENGRYPQVEDADTRSAGSFFRNPIVPEAKLAEIVSALSIEAASVPHWPAIDGMAKLSAAWLIERAGVARGFALGHAAVSSRHTLALTNRGGATSGEIAALREHVRSAVVQKFGVALEQEPVSVGE